MKTGIKNWVLCLALTAGVQAGMKQADTDDFHLSKNVKCLELRSYDLDEKGKWTNERWRSHLLWCSEPLSQIDPKVVKKFRKSKPVFRKSSNIGEKKAGKHINAFVIDQNDKIWRMDEIEDVVKQLGEIDTSAEAQLILWMHGYPDGKRNRKTAKGYEIDIESMEWGPEREVTDERGIAEFCTESRKVVKRAVVDRKGRIVSYRTISKSKKAEQSCIHGDPEPIYPEK